MHTFQLFPGVHYSIDDYLVLNDMHLSNDLHKIPNYKFIHKFDQELGRKFIIFIKLMIGTNFKHQGMH